MWLWANNVTLPLKPFYLRFRDRAVSTRVELAVAVGRLAERGELEVSLRQLIDEVHVSAPEIPWGTVRQAVIREVGRSSPWVDPIPIERTRYGFYRIVWR